MQLGCSRHSFHTQHRGSWNHSRKLCLNATVSLLSCCRMFDIRRECNSVEKLRHDPRLLSSQSGRFVGVPGFGSPPSTRVVNPSSEVDVLIVGGGIHGVAIACQLQRVRSDSCRLLIVEPSSTLLYQFSAATTALDQRVMRSPYEHQLAPDGALQLIDFARLHFDLLSEPERRQVLLGLSGQRSIVPTDVFMAHCIHIARVHSLHENSLRAKVSVLRHHQYRGRSSWLARLESGDEISARAIILATGSTLKSSGRPLCPQSCGTGILTYSAYANNVRIERGKRLLIVGGGMSAGHWILRAGRLGCEIVWSVRSKPRFQCADFPTRYFRTEGIADFTAMSTARRRECLIDAIRGSLMLEFLPVIRSLRRCGQLRVLAGEPQTHTINEMVRGRIAGLPVGDGSIFRPDIVIYATGFTPECRLLHSLAELEYNYYPVLKDSTLEASGLPNLFVSGSLAAMSLGPAARNVDGARHAALRIIPALLRRGLISSGKKPKHFFAISGSTTIGPPVV